MKILALDSSAKTASAAVLEDGKVISRFDLDAGFTHSQTLMTMAESVLKTAGIPLREIDLFAVSSGPGSYTGVRIGVSAVKGMAFSHGKLCAGVSTLEAIAWNLRGLEGTVCAVMDARCGQVYNGIFSLENDKPVRLIPDRAISFTELIREIQRYTVPVYLAGDGAALCYEQMREIESVRLAPPMMRIQNACGVGLAATEAYKENKAVDSALLIPVYLRLSQAERELNHKERRNQ